MLTGPQRGLGLRGMPIVAGGDQDGGDRGIGERRGGIGAGADGPRLTCGEEGGGAAGRNHPGEFRARHGTRQRGEQSAGGELPRAQKGEGPGRPGRGTQHHRPSLVAGRLVDEDLTIRPRPAQVGIQLGRLGERTTARDEPGDVELARRHPRQHLMEVALGGKRVGGVGRPVGIRNLQADFAPVEVGAVELHPRHADEDDLAVPTTDAGGGVEGFARLARGGDEGTGDDLPRSAGVSHGAEGGSPRLAGDGALLRVGVDPDDHSTLRSENADRQLADEAEPDHEDGFARGRGQETRALQGNRGERGERRRLVRYPARNRRHPARGDRDDLGVGAVGNHAITGRELRVATAIADHADLTISQR